ncbi:MAG: hypothetical protein ABI435_10740 [Pseudolysinimonas sp.]
MSSEVRIRRAPKIGVFLVLGAVVGMLGTLIATSMFPSDPAVGFLASFLYFCLYGIPAGVVLGAVIGIVLDVIATRRARTVTVAIDEIRDEVSE